MADVFISYSKRDRADAQSLADDLKVRGFDVWWDFELYAGDDFHDMIRKEIGNAKAVVVIWSEAAVASKWVRGEAEEASDLGTLISTHVTGFDPRKVPLNFRALHCEPVVSRDRVVAAIERRGAHARASESGPISINALANLRARAAAGDASVQFALGMMHETGHGAAQDHIEAMRLYLLAAQQGHTGAQCKLGRMYEEGSGVAKNSKQAACLYRMAADLGDAAGQSQLGRMYAEGSGVARDYDEAVRLFRLAAEQGDSDATAALRRLGKQRRWS